MTKGTRVEVIEKLQDANKKLRAKNRKLTKELKRLTADIELMQSLWQAEIADIKKKKAAKKIKKKEDKIPPCPVCGNKTLETSRVGVWTMERCGSCDHFDRRQDED